jgi:Phage tail tube protein, TTP
MSNSLPNGAIVAIASGYGTAVTITAITNASPAVATATNTFAAGDFIEITSGWSNLNGKVVRLSAAAAGNFTLEGIDTTSTTRFPAGSGAGTARKVTGYTQISQVLSLTTSGGDQQFTTYQYLESDGQRQIPTTRAPMSIAMSVADDASLPGFQGLLTANNDRLQRALKVTLPSGAILSYNGYITFNSTPTLTVNEIMACASTFSLLAEPVRY